VEFGSGTSTVLMSRALARTSSARLRSVPARQLAFEHLEQYREQTVELLKQYGTSAEVVLAPLTPYRSGGGAMYPYYNCQEALERLAIELDQGRGKRVLVVVDGPPAKTGKHARYPALPVVMASLPHAYLDVVLDDFARNDEKETARLWQQELEAKGVPFSCVEKKLEKEACVVFVRPGTHGAIAQ
jgi:DNA repair protein SbcC/Rad50